MVFTSTKGKIKKPDEGQAALDAGNDMFMTTYPTKAVDMKNTLLELARQSDDYLVRIEKSVARILKMKFRTGLLTSH